MGVAAAVTIATFAGCSLFVDLGGLQDGPSLSCDGGCGDTSTSDQSVIDSDAAPDSSSSSGPCPSGRGPAMVEYLGVCIDSTEVTKADYYAFLSEHPTVKQDGPCVFNTTYAPGNPATDSDPPNVPMDGLDWCDARDFCAWSGKHLCGDVDGGPMHYPENSFGAWYQVCSQGGLFNFPYSTLGSEQAIDGACFVGDTDAAARPLPPKSFPLCDVADAGIYDMIGNSEEWANICAEANDITDDAGDTVAEGGAPYGYCLRLGGYFATLLGDVDCRTRYALPRDSTGPSVRCCAEPR